MGGSEKGLMNGRLQVRAFRLDDRDGFEREASSLVSTRRPCPQSTRRYLLDVWRRPPNQTPQIEVGPSSPRGGRGDSPPGTTCPGTAGPAHSEPPGGTRGHDDDVLSVDASRSASGGSSPWPAVCSHVAVVS